VFDKLLRNTPQARLQLSMKAFLEGKVMIESVILDKKVQKKCLNNKVKNLNKVKINFTVLKVRKNSQDSKVKKK
jgi:hypothetical protein